MKKSLSLFVASSMVVSMFAGAAYAAEEKDPGEFLNELGVIQGDQNGDLMEDANWSRKNVTVLMSRLFDEETEAKETEKGHEFTDVTDAYYDGFITWAVAEGLFEGRDADTFGYNEDMTNQEFYAVILRALGYDTKGPEAYATVPDLAVELELATEETDFTAVPTRGETYATIVAALNTNVKDTGETLGVKLGLIEVVAPEIAASAIGAKKIEVKFNQAVDKAKAEVAVKNGNHTLSVKEATWAEDGKSVVLEFATNLAAAEYTVTVGGVTEAGLTSTVKVEEEKVAEIKLLSDKAALTRKATQDYLQVTASYVVTNQYGEDITAATSLNATSTKGVAVASNGAITVDVTSPAFFNINEQIHVTLLHNSGTYTNATLTVATEGRVASVAITGIHHDDKKELQVGKTAAEYSLVLDLKDQYGNKVTTEAYAEADLVAISTNPLVANIALADITPKTIDNEVKLVLPLSVTGGTFTTAGTATVSLMSITTSNKATYDVQVKDALKLDKLTLSQPVSAPAGALVEIPFTAVDQFGAVIDHPTTGQLISKSITGADASQIQFVKDVVKNKTALQVRMPSVKGSAVIVLVTQTNEVVRLTVNVTDSKAVSSVGGTKDLATNVLKTDAVTIGTGNIVGKDQYYNDITIPYAALADTGAAINGKYRAIVTSSNSNVTVTNGGLVYSDQSVVLNGDLKGSATITIKLEVGVDGAWKPVANSSYNYTQKVVEKGDIKSYEATIGKIFAATTGDATPVGHEKAVEVKGVLEDGTKVTIPATLTGGVADNYEVVVNEAGVVYDENTNLIAVTSAVAFGDKTEKEFPVLVLVKGANAETVTVTATTSKAAATLDTWEAKDVTTPAIKKENATTISIAKADLVTLATAEAVVEASITAKDQYGVALNATAIASAINGAVSSVAFASAEVGKSLTITATTTNNKVINLTVVVK